MESCRICLFKVIHSTNIFSACLQNMLISEVLKQLAPVEVSEEDELPKVICKTCLEKLRNVVLLRAQIVNSDFQLRQRRRYLEEDSVDCKDVDCKQEILLDIEENSIEFKEIVEDNVLHNFSLDLKNQTENFENNDEDEFSDDQLGSLIVPKVTIESEPLDGNGQIILTKILEDNLECDSKESIKRKKDNREFKCKECGEKFEGKAALMKHIVEHTGIIPYHCDFCKKGFTMRWQMNNHRKIHFEERSYKCTVCPKSYKTHTALIIHNNRVHLGKKPHKCDICSKAFPYSSELEGHRRRHTGEKPFICEFCSKCFAQLDNLRGHLRVHKKYPQVPCPVCGKTYPSSSLHKHLKRHSGERPYDCKICHKKFTEKGTLNSHMRIHDGVKPYSCKICEKKFTHSGTLSTHMRSHTGEKPFACTSCEKKFAYKHHLASHVKKQHVSENSN